MRNTTKEKAIKSIGKIMLYKNKVEVRLEKDSIWMTQQQMATLFNTERSVITKHVRNIFRTKELDEKSNVQKMHIANSDKPVKFYNLDVAISVGYRVNSKQGTQFRIWATDILRQHLLNGYTLNENHLKKSAAKYKELQRSIKLIGNVLKQDNIANETKGIIKVIIDYSKALELLDDYDHKRLTFKPSKRKEHFRFTYELAKEIIVSLIETSDYSGLVGQEKDKGLESTIGAIYQTFDKQDVYPTVAEKAAHLLYFVTKNHSFVDGNKRIAAAFFIYYLDKNKLLKNKDGSKRIDDYALAALTLMIACSRPADKEDMINVILNMLG